MILNSRLLMLFSFVYAVSILDFRPFTPAFGKPNKKASELAAANNHTGVIDYLAKHIDKLNKDDLLLLANAYSKNKNFLEAQKIYANLLAKKSKDTEVRTLYARSLLDLGRDKEAILEVKIAIQDNPKYESAYLLAGEIFEKRKNRYEHRALYLDAIINVGEKTAFLTKICELATLDNLFDMSTEYCTKGIKKDPREPKNYLHLALTKKELGLVDEAIDLYKKTSARFPKSADAQLYYAKFLLSQKDYIEANKYYKKASEADSNSAVATIGLAETFFEMQKYKESLAAYTASCKINKFEAYQPFRKIVNKLKILKQNEVSADFEKELEKCGL